MSKFNPMNIDKRFTERTRAWMGKTGKRKRTRRKKKISRCAQNASLQPSKQIITHSSRSTIYTTSSIIRHLMSVIKKTSFLFYSRHNNDNNTNKAISDSLIKKKYRWRKARATSWFFVVLHGPAHSSTRHLWCHITTTTLGTLDRLIDGQDEAGCFASCGQGVYLHDCWLPHAILVVVHNILGVDVHSVPAFSTVMLLT